MILVTAQQIETIFSRLEAAEKRIAELENASKHGEYITEEAWGEYITEEAWHEMQQKRESWEASALKEYEGQEADNG